MDAIQIYPGKHPGSVTLRILKSVVLSTYVFRGPSR